MWQYLQAMLAAERICPRECKSMQKQWYGCIDQWLAVEDEIMSHQWWFIVHWFPYFKKPCRGHLWLFQRDLHLSRGFAKVERWWVVVVWIWGKPNAFNVHHRNESWKRWNSFENSSKSSQFCYKVMMARCSTSQATNTKNQDNSCYLQIYFIAPFSIVASNILKRFCWSHHFQKRTDQPWTFHFLHLIAVFSHLQLQGRGKGKTPSESQLP